MNVRLNHAVNRPVLWQRNADWSRHRATSTPLAGVGGESPVRGVGGIRRRLGVRPLHAALRRPRWALLGGVDPTGWPGGGHLPDPPPRAGQPDHVTAPVAPRPRRRYR